MSKKNSKKLMFIVSVFMITILAGCSHIPQPSETKKDDISKTQLEMTKDEDGNIDDMSQEIDDDADLDDEMSKEDDDMDDSEGVEDMDDDDGDMLSTSTETELTSKESEEKEESAEERNEKTIVMTSFVEIIDGKYFPQFSEKEVTVKKGDKVKFKITNTKGTHDFKIDEFDVFTETPEGEEVEVEFVADKAGEFVYYCTKPGHRQNGHWGTLKVVE